MYFIAENFFHEGKFCDFHPKSSISRGFSYPISPIATHALSLPVDSVRNEEQMVGGQMTLSFWARQFSLCWDIFLGIHITWY
jgi:hypothetical protein